jgi:hypothetical protein
MGAAPDRGPSESGPRDVTTGVDNLARAWARGAAIRPVPSYAVVGAAALRHVEEDLSDDSVRGPSSMDGAFERFEQTQPVLSSRIQEVLDRPLDETALALGYFLSIAVWLAFEHAFGKRLGTVSKDAWSATVDALALEEDLRKKNADEPLELDDVLALEQPDVVAFLNDHIEAALDSDRPYADDADDPAGKDVDVDDVHLVYRTILLETLALSHAVAPGHDEASNELLA